MESCGDESRVRRSKHCNQNKGTTRISAADSEKASTSCSSNESIASEEETVSGKNYTNRNSSSFEGGLRCHNNSNDANNNKGCATSYDAQGQQCSNRLTTGQLNDFEGSPCSPGGGRDPPKNRNRIQDVEENRQQHLQEMLTQQERTAKNYDVEKNTLDDTVTTSGRNNNNNNNLNNEDITSSKSLNHRRHKISSYQQQHHNHPQNHHSSSSSYEHNQNSTQQNQKEHRRHSHHHHSRHKTQRSPVGTSSDFAVTPSVLRNRLHRHHYNNGENSATAHDILEDPDYSSTNDPAITSAFSDPTPNPSLNSHHPSKKTPYSSMQLIPSRTSLSPPSSPISSEGPSLPKKARVSVPEITDIDNESTEKSETHIHCLFPELLVMIFCYLDVRDKGRAAQVCVRWLDAAYTRTVWRGIEAKIHLRRSNPSLFRSLAKRGIRRIQILSLKRSLRDVVAGIPDLESLNLSGCYNITDAGLGQALLHRLLTVHELNLSLCKQITDYSLSRIAIYLKNLRVLHLGGCSVITNAGLFVISYGLVKLKSLDLRSCRDLSDQGIGHLAGLGDEVTNQGNLALEHLCLQDCQKLTDQALRYISIGLKSLTKVNLSFCGGVTDAGLQYLAKMPSLRKINLASCDQVTDAGLAHLARGGSRITSLDVSFCDKIGDWGLSCLAGGLFNLECLSLSACNISDNGISHIVQTMHGLTTLNIGQCHRITDRGLNLIADNLKKLSRMDLYGCTQISAKGLERIMQLPSLSSLNLGLWHKR